MFEQKLEAYKALQIKKYSLKDDDEYLPLDFVSLSRSSRHKGDYMVHGFILSVGPNDIAIVFVYDDVKEKTDLLSISTKAIVESKRMRMSEVSSINTNTFKKFKTYMYESCFPNLTTSDIDFIKDHIAKNTNNPKNSLILSDEEYELVMKHRFLKSPNLIISKDEKDNFYRENVITLEYIDDKVKLSTMNRTKTKDSATGFFNCYLDRHDLIALNNYIEKILNL